MDVAVCDGRIVGVRGREHDRVNRGRLGPKDLFGWQANTSPDRLTRPLMREGGRLVESDWDTAMGRLVERSKRCSRVRVDGATLALTPPANCSSRSTTRWQCSGRPASGRRTWTATGCKTNQPLGADRHGYPRGESPRLALWAPTARAVVVACDRSVSKARRSYWPTWLTSTQRAGPPTVTNDDARVQARRRGGWRRFACLPARSTAVSRPCQVEGETLVWGGTTSVIQGRDTAGVGGHPREREPDRPSKKWKSL
jgi:hypothetical protein